MGRQSTSLARGEVCNELVSNKYEDKGGRILAIVVFVNVSSSYCSTIQVSSSLKYNGH